MGQSSLLNSLVCHLGLLSYLMRLYLYPFCFSLCFAWREGKSKPVCSQFSKRWWTPGHFLFCFVSSCLLGKRRQSRGNFRAADILSLPATRANILQHVNKECWLFRRNQIGKLSFLLVPLFAGDNNSYRKIHWISSASCAYKWTTMLAWWTWFLLHVPF